MRSKLAFRTALLALMLIQSPICLSLASPALERCLEYEHGGCTACHDNYHLHAGQCHINIAGCIGYEDRDHNQHVCAECDRNHFIIEDSGICFPFGPSSQPNSTRILQEGASDACTSNHTFQEGSDLKDNIYFRLVDDFMLRGAYRHFITRSAVYIKSVSVEYDSLEANFRIVYFGGGGGLMLCLVSINIVSKAIELRSFVAIDGGRLVEHCSDYGADGKCGSCDEGYHLQGGLCYRSIENCLRHIRNICIECRGYSLLLENRCLTDCSQTSDAAKMRLFGDVRTIQGHVLPTIEQGYLLRFY